MPSERVATSAAGGPRRRSGAWSVVLFCCLLAIPPGAGCRPRAPRVEFGNRGYSAALRTAANTRSVERLSRAQELIDRDRAAGVIGPEEYACYQAIIGLAEAGRWDAAEREALRFRRDQRR